MEQFTSLWELVELLNAMKSEGKHHDVDDDSFHWIPKYSNVQVPIMIHHVHQLQNLVFDLTGEELEMKT